MTTPFRMLLLAREKLYESGILATKRLNHPVISVGNLTVGGTGKTPLVIALAERLRKEGFRPVILSRGYKRTSSGIVIVSRGDGPVVSCADAGDEPFLIARRTLGVAVVVGANRYEAGLVAEREQLGNLFVLDDGFQHRKLHRSVDIITIDPQEWAAGERLLPTGRWREPRSAMVRAHAACVQTIPGVPLPTLPVPAFQVETLIDGIYDGARPVPPEAIRNRAVVAFAGIAKPERFFAALESMRIATIKRERFPDHHNFSVREINNLGGETLITTEKDAVRLESRGITGYLHLRISVKIPEFDALIALIRSRLETGRQKN